MSYNLHERIFRTLCVFQALIALPAMFSMGSYAMGNVLYPYYPDLYAFVKYFCISFLAAGILFIIIVERYHKSTPRIIFCLEMSKSILATLVWIWILFDAIMRDCNSEEHWGVCYPKNVKIIQAAISILVPTIAFYPTLIYAAVLVSQPRLFTDRERGASGESEPLLGEGM
ncbi:hypothetical protein BJ875DRAFT_480627 [Amylocarpus encephaloides]|uniref:Uncharacterized protein n=1 Tax=Amylocarpus encephaloides TaxID=45428 RepID=A0A9P7YSB6_9HELO|nr:hypothetical protein BJ875DRAFT_480627 [Amylocarpus encephaloides]